MTRSSVFEKLLDPQPPHAKQVDDEEDVAKFYCALRGVRDRALNIEFRKADGPWPFREYSYLIGGEAVHAGEFILRFATGERVTVRGRHLRPLYDKILRHRVIWLREAVEGEQSADADMVIDEIEGPIKDEETMAS